MTINIACDKIEKLFKKNIKEDIFSIERLCFDLVPVLKNLKNPSLSDIKPLFTITYKIAGEPRNSIKEKTEKQLLKILWFLPDLLWDNKETSISFTRKDNSEPSKIVNALIDLVKDLYVIKIPRDSFAGKRRAYCLRILSSLLPYCNVPELLELGKRSIKSKSKQEFYDTTEALTEYYIKTDEILDEGLEKELNKRVLKTKIRSIAVAALNFQVKIGFIDEFDALDAMSDWKEKNYY